MRYMLTSLIPGLDSELDELFQKAVKEVVNYDRANASLLQRRLDIGYARAARILDQLTQAGVVGPAEGSMPREVLISDPDEILPKSGEQSKEVDDNIFAVPTN